MGYNREIFESAFEKIESLKKESILTNEKRKALLYLRFPRAKEIEKELSKTAIKAARAILKVENTRSELEKLKNENTKLQNEIKDILKSANLPEDYLEVHYHCEKCKDEGYIDGKMCLCLKEQLKKETYERLNKLSPLSLSTFESFNVEYYPSDTTINGISPRKKMEKIFYACQEYADSFSLKSPNLFMYGCTGLGKTHLSLAIANNVIKKGFNVVYVSTPNIILKLEKERFGSNYSKEQSDIHLINCDLLILDDLGTEFQTNFSNSSIYNIINSRIMYGRPTIISTNLSFEEIQRNYSERLVSRIMGNYIRMLFIGHDIRPQFFKKQMESKKN